MNHHWYITGVAQLHALGYAHTDIKLANIFVDDDSGDAFLDDLEFVRPVAAAARPEGQGTGEGVTAQQQDMVQLQILAGHIWGL